MLIPVMSQSDIPNEPENLLNQLAFMLLNVDECPKTFEFCDDLTQSLISDFSAKVGIDMVKVKRLPEIEHAIRMIKASMGIR